LGTFGVVGLYRCGLGRYGTSLVTANGMRLFRAKLSKAKTMAKGHNQQHGHSHSHAHHDHACASYSRAFAIGTLFNVGFVIIEAGYGYLAHSLALIADAGHNLSDVLGLLLAWGASALSRCPPTKRYTYGLRVPPFWRRS